MPSGYSISSNSKESRSWLLNCLSTEQYFLGGQLKKSKDCIRYLLEQAPSVIPTLEEERHLTTDALLRKIKYVPDQDPISIR